MIPLLLALSASAHAEGHVLTLLVTNAVEVAKREKGPAAVAIADVFLDINKKALKVIATQMMTRLADRGVRATVVPEKVEFPGPGLTRFYYWDSATSDLVPVALAPDTYVVLRVDIENPDEVLAAHAGSGIAWAMSHMGADTDVIVTQTAAPILLQELQAEGITAVLGM